MKKKIILITISFTITLGLILSLTNKKYYGDIKVKFNDNDYVLEYVKKNNINYEKIADSEKNKYTINIENFSYNNVNGTLEITEYKGISETLIIPYDYDGIKITSISDSFKNDKVKSIYISDNITYLPIEKFKNVTINCYRGKFCEELKNNNELTVNILNDSDKVDFSYVEFLFEYNVKNGNVELVSYKGKDKDVVVPETVDGMKVTAVDFNVSYKESVYLPDTINEISDNFITLFNYNNYKYCLISAIVSFVLSIVMIIIVKDRTPEELIRSTPIYVGTFVFLGINFYANYMFNHIKNASYNTILSFTIISNIIYIIMCFAIMIANKRNQKIDNDTKNNTKFIDEMISKINDVSNLKKDYKNKLIDKLKYSDPVSNKMVKNIEDNISSLIDKLSDKSSDKEIDDIIKLIENRNSNIKRNK